MSLLKKYIVFICLCVTPFFSSAQITSYGSPFYDLETLSKDQGNKSTMTLPLLDYSKIKSTEHSDNPLYSVPTAVNLSMQNAGFSYDLPNGDKVWMLKIESQNAKGIAVFYEDFYLPEGARLFMFDSKKKQIKGAYTSRNNKESGRFFTGFIHESVAYLEYYEPENVVGQGHFTIFRIDQSIVEEGEKESLLNFGFGTSSGCHVNANCTEGDTHTQEKKGICRIMMALEEGTIWCTGSLINNANNDETPYVLSAFHCQDGYTPLYDLWRFDFNYESSNCTNPNTEPTAQSIIGCSFRAGRQVTDFMLLEINQSIPVSYNVVFNGWDRTNATPSSMTLIHHPSGDIKKISKDNNALLIHPNSINWNNSVSTPANHHLRSTLDVGSFQVGSSGAPFFDENGRIVAQLHGGIENCTQAQVYGGRLFYSWNEGTNPDEQLQPWLDPDSTNIDFVDGLEPYTDGLATISGKVVTETGASVAGVTVQVSGGSSASMVTDLDGQYSFELAIGGAYNISFEKNFGFDNGVRTTDITKIRRGILGIESLDSPYKLMAGDVNGTFSNPTTSDILEMRRVILGINTVFPNGVPSWRFVPSIYIFPSPENPYSNTIPDTIVIGDLQSNIIGIDIIGVKMGDVNGSVIAEE